MILPNRQDRILDRQIEDQSIPSCGRSESRQHGNCGGFTCSVLSQQCEQFTLFNGKARVSDGHFIGFCTEITIYLSEIDNLQFWKVN